MFIRPCYRGKNGKRHAYWALMESYRTERGPRQRVVAYLGQLDEPRRLGVKEAAEGRQGSRQKRLFDDVAPQWVEVDVKRVRVENRRDFGGPWLGLELAEGNPLARRGYSRDHRPDCKQVCIGLVVTKCGMPLGHEVFAGNRPDVTTLQEIVETMERRYGRADRIWVGDRGMVSADNIAFLKQGGRR
jgi:hypothetical protein